MAQLSEAQARWLADSPVGRLATASASGAPHVIPVCYAFDGQVIYSVLDQKPKSAPLTRLRRVRNIQANSQVSLVVDHYEDDWNRLAYLLVIGRAEVLLPEVLSDEDERAGAVRLLREKYHQYRAMDVDANPVIKIVPERIVSWGTAPD